MAPQIKYTKLFIDNEWVDAVSGKTFDTYNPHDGSVIAKVAEGGKADIEAAVGAAKRAFHRKSEWRLMDASQRGKLLYKLADLVERDLEYLAQLESSNNGMILTSAKRFIASSVNSVRYIASLADKIQGDTIPMDGDVFTYTLKQPVGVCGLVLPWNGPIIIFLNKVATCLAAGCTAVVKPAEQTPLTALALAALVKEAGFPPGVVNVVNGFGSDAGVALTHHPDVAKISFTGSLEVRRTITDIATAALQCCTAVVKPAEQTPLTALALAALVKEAGFPPGVVNVVNGFGSDAGVALTHHPDVAKISFTGSLEVGKLIQKAAGTNNLKRVTLELGGKSPLVIMDDADLNVAVPMAAYGVFGHQGQMCIAASRLFVQAGIYDKFVEAATKYAKGIKVGSPADPTTQHGPQIDGVMLTKILGYIESGKKEGANLMTGGKRVGTSGYYVEPTVFANVTDDMTIAKEEIFGPVQSILKFDTLDEVIDRANATNYGLAAGIFTTNINNALHFSKHVEAGTVWVNTYLAFSHHAPFGGFKESGIGRENGIHCVDEYLEVKTVTTALSKNL